MMLNSVLVLCLSLFLFHTNFSLAKRGGGGSFGRSFGSKKIPTSNRGSTSTNTGHKHNQGSSSQGGYPRQPGQPNQGGYPLQPGRPGYPGSYPQQQGGGGYYNQYQAQGSPYGGSYGGYGGHGGYGGYPGGYMNYNPKNKVLSPRFGGSYGYGGYGYRGGSPFSNSVQAMGFQPNDKSKEYGRNAAMAAAGGAMAGMAIGYGLGRFPRPQFRFHSSQEEYYYNHYMHRKYGAHSTDTNDYSRDYRYNQPPKSYDDYMDSCMKRRDLLPVEKSINKPAATTTTAVKITTTTSVNTTSTAAPDTGISSTTATNSSTAAENSSTSAPSTPRPLNQLKANPVPSTSQIVRKTATDDDDDDDTVSIVEIGYPALIEQQKVRRCLEMYMDYSEKYLKRVAGGVQGLKIGSQGFFAVVTSTIVMLLNSNILVLLH